MSFAWDAARAFLSGAGRGARRPLGHNIYCDCRKCRQALMNDPGFVRWHKREVGWDPRYPKPR